MNKKESLLCGSRTRHCAGQKRKGAGFVLTLRTKFANGRSSRPLPERDARASRCSVAEEECA
jgi:hypothetical protein